MFSGLLEAGWATAWTAVWRPRVAELLLNTVSLTVLTTVAASIVGVAYAWLVERTTLPGARWWRIAAVAPLAVPAFVNAYAWVGVRPSMSGLGGAVLITTLSYFPFVFLPVAAMLRGMDRTWEDAAGSLGLGPWATFIRAVLPLLRPAILGGALLVALHLLSEFGALAMIRFPTFTTAILDQYEAAFDPISASVLAVVLLTVSTGVLTIEQLARGRGRHARLGAGVRVRPVPAPLGPWRLPALVGLTCLTILSLGVPGWSLVRWLSHGVGGESTPQNLVAALTTTVSLAAVTGLVTIVAALPIALLLRRRPTRFGAALERVTYLASSLPGVVVALALVTIAVSTVRPLYQSTTLLIVAYIVLFLPRALVAIRGALAQAPTSLVEAARALGVAPWRASLRVLLPLAMPGLLAGYALVVVATSTELTATLMLAPTGTTTLSTAFWAASDSLDYALAAPHALAMVLVSAPLTWLLLHHHEDSTG